MVKRASPHLQTTILTQMRAIGVNCPEILAEHRKLFEELREQASLRDCSQAALDVIEGRRYSLIIHVYFALNAVNRALWAYVCSSFFDFSIHMNIGFSLYNCLRTSHVLLANFSSMVGLQHMKRVLDA